MGLLLVLAEDFYGVRGDNGYNCVQIFSCAGNTNVYYRQRWGNPTVWSPWQKVATAETYSTDYATTHGDWNGVVNYTRVGRLCMARFELKGSTAGDMLSIPDWALPAVNLTNVAGETVNATGTQLFLAMGMLHSDTKTLTNAWIPGNIFNATITYIVR